MNLIRLSIQRPTFISMMTLFFLFLGVLALKRIPIDLYPEVNYPVISVRVTLPGAAPKEVEELVTKRVEDVMSTLAGVKTLRSISREESSIVSLEFAVGEDIRFQENQVRAKVASIRRSLPEEITEPVVARQDPDAAPIMEISLTGEREASQLTEIAEDIILTRLQQLPGVGDVTLSGERTQEIAVDLKPHVLDAWKMNAADIVAAVKKFQTSKPVGKVEGNERNWLIRTFSQALTIKDLEKIPVGSTIDKTPIYLRDVADITPSFKSVSRISRFNDGQQLKSAILILVTKQSGENTVGVSDAVSKEIKKLIQELPSDIQLRVTRDNAETIRTNVADVFESLIIAAILTVIVVLLFLRSPRSTLTTGLALPSSLLTTFVIINMAGFTLNIMTLLAMSLSIGLVVDDAIVVRENIFRHMHEGNTDPKDAAYKGTSEVALAVTATTLTLVAMFLPVGSMSSIIGQFFKPFALTVVFAMLVSLWDALTMAPLMSAYFANISNVTQEWKQFGKVGLKIDHALHRFEQSFDKLTELYKRFLAWSLSRIRFGLGVGVVALLLAWVGMILVKKSFIPAQLGESFSVRLDGPIAIPLDKIQKSAEKSDELLRGVKDIQFWTITAGTSWGGTAQIEISVQIKPEAAKNEQKLKDVREVVRKTLSVIPGYKIQISETADPLAGATGGGGGRFAPISISLTGKELDVLTNLYNQVRNIVEHEPNVIDVSTLQDEGLPEVRFNFDRFLLGKFNLSPSTISENMRVWVEGDTSNKLSAGDTQIPIRIKLKDGDHLSAPLLQLRNIYSSTTKGQVAIPLANFSEIATSSGPTTISRENRQRILRLNANVKAGVALGDVLNSLKDKLNNVPKPLGYDIKFAGQAQQMSELFSEITTALLIGSIFVFMVLASLFESLLQPLTVMSAIPLAISGAALALIIFGVPLDLYGGIGMILLAGIVAKNSILLVDLALERVHKEGVDPAKAMLETAPSRLRPILMTSAAMIVGMLPVAIGIGAAGGARRALGLATVGGVLSSTFLSLVVVPSLFCVVQKFSDKLKKRNSFSKETK